MKKRQKGDFVWMDEKKGTMVGDKVIWKNSINGRLEATQLPGKVKGLDKEDMFFLGACIGFAIGFIIGLVL